MADVIFLIDSSSSIRQNSWNTDMQFISSVINRMNIGSNAYRVAAVKYSTRASLVFNVDQYMTSSQAASAVLGINQDGGSTNLAEAFQIAFSQVLVAKSRMGASLVRHLSETFLSKCPENKFHRVHACVRACGMCGMCGMCTLIGREPKRLQTLSNVSHFHMQ